MLIFRQHTSVTRGLWQRRGRAIPLPSFGQVRQQSSGAYQFLLSCPIQTGIGCIRGWHLWFRPGFHIEPSFMLVRWELKQDQVFRSRKLSGSWQVRRILVVVLHTGFVATVTSMHHSIFRTLRCQRSIPGSLPGFLCECSRYLHLSQVSEAAAQANRVYLFSWGPPDLPKRHFCRVWRNSERDSNCWLWEVIIIGTLRSDDCKLNLRVSCMSA